MAILQLRTKQYEKCQQTLDTLIQSLGQAKKKKNSNTQSNNANVIPAPTQDDTLWWQARIDVLLAYCISKRIHTPEEKSNKDKLEKQFQDVMQKLKTNLEKAKQKDTNHSMAFYLTLHLEQLQQEQKDSVQWLQSIYNNKSYPAVTASLAKAYQDRNQPEKAKELLLQQQKGANGNQMVAELAMTQENYQEAITLYTQALKDDPNNQGVRARLVEALSHVDPKQAMEEWNKLQGEITADYGWEDDDVEEDEETGEALEMRELPRIKHGGDAHSAAGTTNTGSALATKNKKSKEAVLRKRAKKREAYLEQLKEKGLYNPSRPVQPDPERWIPKHERQRRRRGRGGQNNKSSQGGVSAKDAAKLDVAARVAGADAGNSNSGPSTAHLTVASGPRKGGRRR